MRSSLMVPYGQGRTLILDPDASAFLDLWQPPPPLPDVRRSLAAALAEPLEFPPFRQCVFPDDRIACVLDRFTPCGTDLVAGLWEVFEVAGVSPSDVTLLQPADFHAGRLSDPRTELPESVRRDMAWEVHDPVGGSKLAYLASTAGGERAYLSRTLIDADTIITLGLVGFDPVLGYRGTSSVLYPGLSSPEAFQRFQGQGHDELDPEASRPLRQMVDEIAWLLGGQMSVQVVPALQGGIAAVRAGLAEPVFREAVEHLNAAWRITTDQRLENVIVSIDDDGSGTQWAHVAAALECARRLVQREGRIVVLSELTVPPGPGVRLLADARTPREILRVVREITPPDLLEATRLAQALEWANISLLSRLESDLVESLFMSPLQSEEEARRLIGHFGEGLIIPGAQRAYGQIQM